jgi:hypothetical protein
MGKEKHDIQNKDVIGLEEMRLSQNYHNRIYNCKGRNKKEEKNRISVAKRLRKLPPERQKRWENNIKTATEELLEGKVAAPV